MILTRSTDPSWLSNAYLVAEREGGTAVVIDTGAPVEPLLRTIAEQRLVLAAILCTHRHPDHVSGNEELARETGASIHALGSEAPHIPAARPLEDGQRIGWGDLDVRVLALPGHTSGQCGFLVAGVGLFTGDCLFEGSLGGTMGPASSGFENARRSVGRILALPDETPIHPGHGEPTTVGRERDGNPFIRVMSGREREGDGRCRAMGRAARLIVLARDYDGGTKAWVRFDDDGGDAIVPGSRVDVLPRALTPP